MTIVTAADKTRQRRRNGLSGLSGLNGLYLLRGAVGIGKVYK